MTDPDPIVLEAIRLIRSAIWPIVLVLALLLFHAPLTRLIDRLQNITAKRTESGFEVALAAASLGAAEARRPGGPALSPADIASTVRRAQSEMPASGFGTPTILWVDDNPDNNVYERNALEVLGVRFRLAASTDEAKKQISANGIDLVISDFKREADPDAGYGLLDYLKTQSNPPPYIIYAASATPALVAEAKSRGAFGETNRPAELFSLVVDALARSLRPSR